MTINIPTPAGDAAVTPTTVSAPAAPAAPEPDKVPPPVAGPLAAMLRSKKALVMVCTIIASTVLVALGKIDVDKAVLFAGAIIGIWMHAQGTVDKAKAEASKVIGLCVFLTLTTACGLSTYGQAVTVANGARSTEVAAGDLLRDRCTTQYRAAAALKTADKILARVAELDRACVPARKAYGGLRAGRLALLAAITAYQVTKNEAALMTALTRAAAAATAAADAAQSLQE